MQEVELACEVPPERSRWPHRRTLPPGSRPGLGASLVVVVVVELRSNLAVVGSGGQQAYLEVEDRHFVRCSSWRR